MYLQDAEKVIMLVVQLSSCGMRDGWVLPYVIALWLHVRMKRPAVPENSFGQIESIEISCATRPSLPTLRDSRQARELS